MYTDAPVAQKKLELDVSLQEAAQRRLKILASKRKTAAKLADPHAKLPSGTVPISWWPAVNGIVLRMHFTSINVTVSVTVW
jgi:hypothetical protein